jgi:eukaryotic-like serine/threonine-protein kinase
VILWAALVTAVGAQEYPIGGVPTTLPGTPAPLPQARTTIAWTVPIVAAATTSPLIVGDLVLVAHLPGIIAAFHRSDGGQSWRAELNPEQPLATDGTLLFVAAGEAIHALRLSDGSVTWRSPANTLTAPLLVKDGWIIAASEGKITARRATDGSTVWAVDSGVQREAPAISGDVLFVPLADGRVIARDLANGQARWERRVSGAPRELLVVDDRIFFGGDDKAFYCLNAGSGEIEWRRRVGAVVRGRASTDGERVFFAALDNMIRAVDRWNGEQRWQKGVPFRPLVGPLAAGGAVFVLGSGTEMRVLLAADGNNAGTITFPARVALTPAFSETAGGVVLAAVTGGLEESWKLSLTHPVPVTPTARPTR